jgi:hypothetical protein
MYPRSDNSGIGQLSYNPLGESAGRMFILSDSAVVLTGSSCGECEPTLSAGVSQYGKRQLTLSADVYQ